MIDKSAVITLYQNGWTKARIARKFKVSDERIRQIVSLVSLDDGQTKCEVCNRPIEKEIYIDVEGADEPLLVCNYCQKMF